MKMTHIFTFLKIFIEESALLETGEKTPIETQTRYSFQSWPLEAIQPDPLWIIINVATTYSDITILLNFQTKHENQDKLNKLR